MTIKRVVLSCLKGYKRYLSPMLPPSCRFVPSCSEYFHDAVERKGLLCGTLLGVRRLLRCNPLTRGGRDPVI